MASTKKSIEPLLDSLVGLGKRRLIKMTTEQSRSHGTPRPIGKFWTHTTHVNMRPAKIRAVTVLQCCMGVHEQEILILAGK